MILFLKRYTKVFSVNFLEIQEEGYGSLKIKLTAFRILLEKLFRADKYERKASFDLIFAKMGKQSII